MKHAPGPWKIAKDGSIEGNDHTQVATFIDNPDDITLIAAAPALLEALEACTRELQRLENPQNYTSSVTLNGLQAIQQAKGTNA